MKRIFNVLMAALAVFAVCSFVACNNNAGGTEEVDTSNPFNGNTYQTKDDTDTIITYAFSSSTVAYTLKSVVVTTVTLDYTYTDTVLTLSTNGTTMFTYSYKFDNAGNLLLAASGSSTYITFTKQ